MSGVPEEMSTEEWKQLAKLQQKAALNQSPGKDSDDFQLVSAVTAGAMTDGSKRRSEEGESAHSAQSKRVVPGMGTVPAPSYHTVPVASSSGVNAGYVGSFSMSTPMPSEPPLAFDLPPGVPTVDRWGETLIDFGRFQNTNVTYAELFHNPDPVIQEYVQWASSRTKESHGLLSDFARYIQVMRKSRPAVADQQGPKIPGSQRVRRFR